MEYGEPVIPPISSGGRPRNRATNNAFKMAALLASSNMVFRFDGADETIVIIKSNFYASVLATSYWIFSLGCGK